MKYRKDKNLIYSLKIPNDYLYFVKFNDLNENENENTHYFAPLIGIFMLK
jgi:hypothetical protein